MADIRAVEIKLVIRWDDSQVDAPQLWNWADLIDCSTQDVEVVEWHEVSTEEFEHKHKIALGFD